MHIVLDHSKTLCYSLFEILKYFHNIHFYRLETDMKLQRIGCKCENKSSINVKWWLVQTVTV